MLRVAIVGALNLASQTAVGDGVVHTNAGGKDSELNIHIEVGADFDKIFFGELTQSAGTMTIGTITVKTSSNSTMVMSVGDGSVSMVNHVIARSEVTGQPPQPPQEHCMKCGVEHAKAPADVKACLAALAGGLKPSTTKGGFDGYEEDMAMPGGSTSKATLFMDSEGLIHELASETVVHVPNQPSVTTSFDIPLTPKAGSPDEAHFAVDPAWKCEAPPTGSCPAPPSSAPPQMLQVYKCFVSALERAQARDVVV